MRPAMVRIPRGGQVHEPGHLVSGAIPSHQGASFGRIVPPLLSAVNLVDYAEDHRRGALD